MSGRRNKDMPRFSHLFLSYEPAEQHACAYPAPAGRADTPGSGFARSICIYRNHSRNVCVDPCFMQRLCHVQHRGIFYNVAGVHQGSIAVRLAVLSTTSTTSSAQTVPLRVGSCVQFSPRAVHDGGLTAVPTVLFDTDMKTRCSPQHYDGRVIWLPPTEDRAAPIFHRAHFH